MSDQTTYQPIAGNSNDFKLVEPTRGNEKALNKIAVRFAALSVEERKTICAVEKWEAEKTIPELTADVRIGISALSAMLDRVEEDKQLRRELGQLVEDYSNDRKTIEPLSADEYWLHLAEVLFVSFPDKVDPESINRRVVQQAYTDFFS